jgi:hypothetical protein
MAYERSSGTSRSNGSDTREVPDRECAPAPETLPLLSMDPGRVGPGSPHDEGNSSDNNDESPDDAEALDKRL